MTGTPAVRFIFPSTASFQGQPNRGLQQARDHHRRPEAAMNVSDVLLECAKECARLSRECGDERIADALFAMSARLLSTATYDAELVMDAAGATPQAGPQSRESDLIDRDFNVGA
jgi:hypothetical protein